MTKWAAPCLFLFVLGGNLPAGEQVRRVQEELRKRHVYYGDIDGRLSKETSGALRSYQERKGLAATGSPDQDTLRSLEISGDAADAALPDVTVLKSDVAAQIIESDRKLLEEVESQQDTPPIGELLPEEPDEKEPAAPAPEPAPPPAEVPPPPPSSLSAQAGEFVRRYLEVCAQNQLDGEMAFYADRVRYFEHGLVPRDFIRRDVRSYYQRWPERNYALLDLQFGRATESEIEVKFHITYRVKSPEHVASGRTLNVFTVRSTPEGLRFVSMKEKRERL